MKKEQDFNIRFPAGHFYSPFPDIDYLKDNINNIFKVSADELEKSGINLCANDELDYLVKIANYYKDIPFPEEKTDEYRYFYNNSAYSYQDAIFLYGMLRLLKPANLIEVGCGYSSCVTLDTNELFLANKCNCTFIEPYPELLNTLIRPDDHNKIRVIPTNLQEVDLDEFSILRENDVLFIDSSHVSKMYSDVNYLYHKVLPRLNKGVYIHIHDIFYPFEYPMEWVKEGRAWNESYLLRSFLQYNDTFEIVIFSNYINRIAGDYINEHMPLCNKNTGGHIWLKKKK